MLPKSTEGRKLVIHEQLGTKPAAEYRSGELRDPKKKKSLSKVHSYCQKYIILILRKLREFYLRN